MAKKKAPAPKAALEREYNVPLRKEFMKAPGYKRAKKAVTALKQFVSKHMKSDDVSISKYANQHIWKDGIKNPPHHIKIKAIKDDKGKVTVELIELTGKAKREEAKLKAAKKAKEEKDKQKEAEKNPLKAAAQRTSKPAEKKEDKATELEKTVEKVKEEKQEAAKEVEKAEIKEAKKEQPKQEAPKAAPEPKQQDSKPTAPKSQ